MDQCSAARHPISATGTLTNRPGRDLALEIDHRFSCEQRSPTGGSENSVPHPNTYPMEARYSVPISCGTLTTVSYAGDITPEETWKLLSENPDAVLVDCRTEAEWRFVGRPDLSSLHRDTVFIEWNRSDGTRNDGFVDDLKAAGITPGDRPVAFLCRSGNRSIAAAEAATEAGIGFEGDLDEHKHRGRTGWKAVGLPWTQS